MPNLTSDIDPEIFIFLKKPKICPEVTRKTTKIVKFVLFLKGVLGLLEKNVRLRSFRFIQKSLPESLVIVTFPYGVSRKKIYAKVSSKMTFFSQKARKNVLCQDSSSRALMPETSYLACS